MDEASVARRRAVYRLQTTSIPMSLRYAELCYRIAYEDVERRMNERKNYILSRHLQKERIENVSDFCTCGHCKPVAHIPVCYAYCCHETERASSANCEYAKRLAQKMSDLECITEHASFASICLDVEVLNMLTEHPLVCSTWLGNVPDLTNREYRYLAYRSFSFWVHGSEAKGNRMDPPLCVLNKIVERFPFDEKIPATHPGLLTLFGSCFFEEYEEGDDMWNYIDSDRPKNYEHRALCIETHPVN